MKVLVWTSGISHWFHRLVNFFAELRCSCQILEGYFSRLSCFSQCNCYRHDALSSLICIINIFSFNTSGLDHQPNNRASPVLQHLLTSAVGPVWHNWTQSWDGDMPQHTNPYARFYHTVQRLYITSRAQMIVTRGKIIRKLGVQLGGSVEHPISAQAMISWFRTLSPKLGSVLTAGSLEPTSDAVSPSLSAPPTPASHSHSLSQK